MIQDIHLVKILVVDDNEADLFLIEKTFDQKKIINNIKTAFNLSEAKAIIDSFDPDIIFTDINLMPDNGFDVLKYAKSHNPLVTVIVMSTIDDGKNLSEAHKLGASCFMNKPINMDQLLRMVGKIEHLYLGIIKEKLKPRLDDTEDTEQAFNVSNKSKNNIKRFDNLTFNKERTNSLDRTGYLKVNSLSK